jgi:hypothetical protein
VRRDGRSHEIKGQELDGQRFAGDLRVEEDCRAEAVALGCEADKLQFSQGKALRGVPPAGANTIDLGGPKRRGGYQGHRDRQDQGSRARGRWGSVEGPLKLLGSVSVPKLNLREFDLDTVKSVADRVSAYGQQASDIAAAVDKTRNNN